MLPPGLKTIGLVDEKDDNDIALWRPFGSRSVKLFLLTDPPQLMQSNVQYVVVGGFNLEAHHLTIADWLQTNGAELIATTNATTVTGRALAAECVVGTRLTALVGLCVDGTAMSQYATSAVVADACVHWHVTEPDVSDALVGATTEPTVHPAVDHDCATVSHQPHASVFTAEGALLNASGNVMLTGVARLVTANGADSPVRYTLRVTKLSTMTAALAGCDSSCRFVLK